MRIVKDVIRENIPQFRKKEKRKNRCRFPKINRSKNRILLPKITPVEYIQVATGPLFSLGGFPSETEVFSPCFDFSVLSPSITISNLRVRFFQSKGYFFSRKRHTNLQKEFQKEKSFWVEQLVVSRYGTTSNPTCHVFLLCVTAMFHFCMLLPYAGAESYCCFFCVISLFVSVYLHCNKLNTNCYVREAYK